MQIYIFACINAMQLLYLGIFLALCFISPLFEVDILTSHIHSK